MTSHAVKILDVVGKIYASIRYSFETVATIVQIRESLYERGLWADNSIYHKFIASVANNEIITQDHPEWIELARRTDNPADAIKNKESHIRDMLANGIREPLEIFYNDDGLYYYHGFHRPCVAEHLKMEKIRVRNHLCSNTLARVANGLFNIYEGDYKYYIYQPLQIPAFSFCTLFNPNIGSKTNAITQHIHKDLPFVDFGAHLGYVAKTLRRDGYSGIAVEVDKRLIDLQEDNKKLTGTAAIYDTSGSMESYMTANTGPCVGIFCSILHHFFKAKSETLNTTIIPWMQTNCVQAFVEHDFPYEKTTEEIRLKYWEDAGFNARPIFTELDGQKRTIFKLTNKTVPYKRLRFDEDAVMIISDHI
jgi:hypothetical protein